jgi:hypothetical protein
VNAELAVHAAAIEAERLRPVPPLPVAEQARRKLARLADVMPVSAEDQARHRAELLAALRNTA